MSVPTLFSFGYWGWGSRTERLVEAMDAVETARGHLPPFFVDIRLQRSVRAVGFNGAAFEKLVGRERHLWLPKLGNESVRTGAAGIVIAEPGAASDLLDLALERWKKKQDLVFFCACERPATCHRGVVAKLLRAEAKRRGTEGNVVEWPGAAPRELELTLPPAAFRKLRTGAKSIPLPPDFPLAEAGALGWGSIVRCIDASAELFAIVGPARHATPRPAGRSPCSRHPQRRGATRDGAPMRSPRPFWGQVLILNYRCCMMGRAPLGGSRPFPGQAIVESSKR
ncbi:MAG: hypothetical protein ABIT01_18500 [Thermoanaerobaculia bacterium]